jgi:hypothetical protein
MKKYPPGSPLALKKSVYYWSRLRKKLKICPRAAFVQIFDILCSKHFWYMIWYDIFVKLQLGWHPVAVVQYTFTQNDTKQTTHRIYVYITGLNLGQPQLYAVHIFNSSMCWYYKMCELLDRIHILLGRTDSFISLCYWLKLRLKVSATFNQGNWSFTAFWHNWILNYKQRVMCFSNLLCVW